MDAATRDRLDAILEPGAGLFFSRQLEFVFPDVMTAETPELGYKLHMPISTAINKGATSYTQTIFERIGVAQLISNYADDLPLAEVAGKQWTLPIKDYGIAYQWSIREQWSAEFGGVPLTAEKGIAAREAAEQRHNRTCWAGDPPVGLYGFFTHPNIPRALLAAAIDAGTAADTILAMLNGLVNGVVSLTHGVEKPSRMLLPTDEYSYVASTRLAAGTDTTILKYFLDNNPYIKEVFPLEECSADSPYNPTGHDLVVVYTPDPSKIRMETPVPFLQLPAEARNLALVVNTMATNGGVNARRPLSAVIAELP